jgi:DNA-binding XRE family transcriptional regulator
MTAKAPIDRAPGAERAELVEIIRARHEKDKKGVMRRRLGSVESAQMHGDRAVLLSVADELQAEIDQAHATPGFHAFVILAERFLGNYPPDIFTGESGDSGPGFVAALRGAVERLHATTGPIQTSPEQSFSERMRLVRERRNMTVSTLARKLGMDRSVVRQLEAGKRGGVTLSTALRIAAALDTTVDWLARGEGEVARLDPKRPCVSSDGQT